MDRLIKQEPVYAEEGNNVAGGLSLSLISTDVKTEDGTHTSETSLNGPGMLAVPETLRPVKLEESSALPSTLTSEQEDEEPEESLSDEGIGRSPAASESIVQSTSEEEAGMSSTNAVDPRKNLLLNSLEKPLFQCKVCGMVFTQELHHSRHMRKHVFVCQFCSLEFSDDLELLKHEEMHREGQQEYVCEECNIVFDSKDLLEMHYADHVYACSYCSKTFTNEFALSNHERGHGGSDINCEDCGKTFTRLSNLKVHQQKHCIGRKTVGVVQSKVLCSSNDDSIALNSSFKKSKPNLATGKSLGQVRGRDMYFHCSECPKAFSNEADFVQHKLVHQVDSGSISHDTSTNAFECKECAKTYPTIEALQSHHLKHKYPCDLCDRTFTNMKKLKVHVNSHSQIFQCPHCEREFKKQHNLKAHILKEHDSGPKDGAQKTGTSSTKALPTDDKKELSVHSRSRRSLQNTENPSSQPSTRDRRDSIHFMEQPEMSKSNPYRKEYKARDTRGSSPERPSFYTCRICQKSFWRKCDLTMHMKRGKHPTLPKSSGAKGDPLPGSGEHKSKVNKVRGKDFQCKVCLRTFTRNSDLNRHTNVKHPGVEFAPIKKSQLVRFRCPSCPKTYDSKHSLLRHIKKGRHLATTEKGFDSKNDSVGGVRPLPFRCTKCPKSYEKNFHLTEHLKLRHPSEWRRQQAINLQTLIEKSNDLKKCISRGFLCRICSKSYRRKCDLTKHMKRNHPSQQTISGRKMHTPSRQDHSRLSDNAELMGDNNPSNQLNTEFPCKFCSKVFARKRYLNRHMTLMHPRSFKCTICPKAYVRKIHLTEHLRLKHPVELSRRHSQNLPPSKLRCKVCSKTFSSNYARTVHMKLGQHDCNSGIQCSICSSIFKQKRYLLPHMKRCHPGANLDTAKLTGAVSSHSSKQQPHTFSKEVKSEEDQSVRTSSSVWSCKICSKTFKRKYKLTIHMKLGKHESGATQCSICSKNFKEKQYLVRHMWQSHGRVPDGVQSKKFGCPRCPKTYAKKCYLKNHFEIKHPDSDWETVSSSVLWHKCKFCSHSFSHRAYLSKHIYLKHPELREVFDCKICKREFNRRSDLSRHVCINGRRVRPGQPGKLLNRTSGPERHRRSFKCRKCSAVCSTNSTLQRHIRTKHPDSNISKDSVFSCEKCEKVFAKKKYLAEHIRRKHRKDSNIKFEYMCTKCNMGFSKRCYLTRHVNHQHRLSENVPRKSNLSEHRPYKCPMCPHTYAQSSGLSKHVTLKHPMHQCKMCLKSFVSERSLRAHIKRRHPEVPSQETSQHMKRMDQKYPIQRKKASQAQEKRPLDSSSGVYQCPQCPKKFATRFSLTTHIKMGKHVKSKNQKRKVDSNSQGKDIKMPFFECEKCPRLFARKCDLTWHLKFCHQTEGQVHTYFQCPKCPLSFTATWNIRKHMKREHPSLAQITTDLANMKMSTAGKCPRCSKSFLRQENYSKHVSKCEQPQRGRSGSADSSSDSKVFRCTKCTRSFRRRIFLEKHMESEHWESESPDATDQEASEAASYEAGTDSEESDAGEDAAAQPSSDEGSSLRAVWKCSECGKEFASRSDLRRHEDTHVFMCSYCNRFFTNRKSLEEHDCPQKKRESAPEKRGVSPRGDSHRSKPKKAHHNCGLCDKSFSSIKELESHQEGHTLNDEDQDDPITSNASIEEPQEPKSTPAIPERFLTCRVCFKVFTSLEAVHNHEMSHFS